MDSALIPTLSHVPGPTDALGSGARGAEAPEGAVQTRAVGWGRGMRPAGWVLSAESRSTSGSAEGPRRRSAPLCKASPRAEPREESEGTAPHACACAEVCSGLRRRPEGLGGDRAT